MLRNSTSASRCTVTPKASEYHLSRTFGNYQRSSQALLHQHLLSYHYDIMNKISSQCCFIYGVYSFLPHSPLFPSTNQLSSLYSVLWYTVGMEKWEWKRIDSALVSLPMKCSPAYNSSKPCEDLWKMAFYWIKMVVWSMCSTLRQYNLKCFILQL